MALFPSIVRWPLIVGSAGVSFLHGTNDGQKSIGLMLMILMGIAPGLYAIDPARDQASYQATSQAMQEVVAVAQEHVDDPRTPSARDVLRKAQNVEALAKRDFDHQPLTEEEGIRLRSEIIDLNRALAKFMKNTDSHQLVSADQYDALEDAYERTTELIEKVPLWVIVLSATALGVGTMIGYRRIVTTLGEKMGKDPVSPAQGLSAQAAAMCSIAAGDVGGLPVSTTHVLTAGVAGSVESGGGRVNWNTIGAILITWFTTLPGTMLASFALALVLHTALV